MPVVAAETCRTLAELRRRIVSLRHAGEHADPNERRIIEAILSETQEFLFGSFGWQVSVDAYGTKVWNDAKDTLSLRALLWVRGGGLLRGAGGHWLLLCTGRIG